MFRNVPGDEIAVVFIRGIAEGLSDEKGKPQDKVQGKVTYCNGGVDSVFLFHFLYLHISDLLTIVVFGFVRTSP